MAAGSHGCYDWAEPGPLLLRVRVCVQACIRQRRQQLTLADAAKHQEDGQTSGCDRYVNFEFRTRCLNSADSLVLVGSDDTALLP